MDTELANIDRAVGAHGQQGWDIVLHLGMIGGCGGTVMKWE